MDSLPAQLNDTLPDVLVGICADTLAEVARRRAMTPKAALKQQLGRKPPPTRGFGAVLTHTVADGGVALIAEIKKASPSAGLIRPDFDPAAIAHAYQDAGAACLSVLTDGPYFGGSADHLHTARAAVPMPVLRKDFMLDRWQILESRVMGADCVLLIMAALTDSLARELEELARALDLDVLAEVHNERELDRALGLQTSLIGINNRNLKTLETDLATTEQLAPLVPSDRFLVAESGIRDHDDLRRLCDAGARCFLVGESLLKQPDVAGATRALLGPHARQAPRPAPGPAP